MGGKRFFETKLVAKVNECTGAADATVRGWAKTKRFSIQASHFGAGDLDLKLVRGDLEGLLEFSYTVTTRGTSTVALATLFYHRLDGTKVEPTDIQPHLTENDVALLQDALTSAIECPGQSP